jgi:hypothetical protein
MALLRKRRDASFNTTIRYLTPHPIWPMTSVSVLVWFVLTKFVITNIWPLSWPVTSVPPKKRNINPHLIWEKKRKIKISRLILSILFAHATWAQIFIHPLITFCLVLSTKSKWEHFGRQVMGSGLCNYYYV